jgi:hypothetical protein
MRDRHDVREVCPSATLVSFDSFNRGSGHLWSPFWAVRVGLIGPLLGDICATRRAAWLNVADRFRQMGKV